jgi:lysozyme
LQFSQSETEVNDALAKEFEGCVLTAYQDLAGVWTIGYGHTGKDVFPGLGWTQAQADEALQHDLNAAAALLNMYSPGLANGALDALVDFVFNLGIGSYRTSTLCQCVNAEDWPNAKLELLKWDHSGGVVVPGLLRRREAEAALLP